MVYKLWNPFAAVQCWKGRYSLLKDESVLFDLEVEKEADIEKHRKLKREKTSSNFNRFFEAKNKKLDKQITKVTPSSFDAATYLETSNQHRFKVRRGAIHEDKLIDDITKLYRIIVDRNLRECNIV